MTLPYSKSQLDALLLLVNQTFALTQKLADNRSLSRNLDRMSRALAELGLIWHDPLGEAYDETRTDCEASIAGTCSENLRITEVIKPIVYWQEKEGRQLVQQGLVVVEGSPSRT
ncbi:MAG: hypothetical protein D6722_24645 [Bacteroidetes bacterium]|nr:MAG: hypothetical protein D6722_24645 [Bacteroidota bacterium]